MTNGRHDFLNELIADPKKIFLIDALGALLTAILLSALLAPLEHYFGMPSIVLYSLSGIGFFLFIYSISCHRFIKSNWKPYLVGIIACNFIYSILSIGLIYEHYGKLTYLGLIYFAFELIVIGIVVTIEFNSFVSYKRI